MEELFETSQPGESTKTKEVETPEVIHELAEKPEEELKQLGVDDPKSFKFWNSKYDKEVNPLKAKVQELEQRLQEKDSKVSEFETFMNAIKNPPIKEEPLIEPQEPTSDDPVEQLDYLKKLASYNKKLVIKQKSEFETFRAQAEKERQEKEEAQKAAQYKAFVAGKFQEKGLKPEEALEAINMYAKVQSNPDEYFGDLVELYKFKKEKNLKTKNKNEQPDIPLPPGIKGGTNVPTEDEAKLFMGSINQRKDVGLFETK